MSSTNIPGRLRFEAEFGATTIRACRSEGQYEERIASTWAGPDKDAARRLVACWNFCEGVETEALEEGAANLATLFEGMKAGADSVTAWRQRAQQAVDALAQVETYLQARVDPNGPSTAATQILPMVRRAIEGSGVAPTQTSWSDCGEV